MGWKASVLDVARRSGALRLLGAAYGGHRLTVVAYHRVADAADPRLAGFRTNVSASPAGFGRQLDRLAERCNVVALGDVLAWLDGERGLPARPALITFDDGYRDNLEVAAPLLAQRGLPATLFLTTGPTDGGPPLFWDEVAWLFSHAAVDEAGLPAVGRRSWQSEPERDRVVHEVVYATKRLPPSGRSTVLRDLRTSLRSEAPDRIPGLYLSWDDVRSLDGWSIGAHTVGHPVLTSLQAEAAVDEIADSCRRIREETGEPVRAFAYPNGLTGDIDETAAAAAAVDLAFSLRPGPATAREIRRNPLDVRRIYVTASDSEAKVEAKLMGIGRLPGASG